MAGFVMRSLEEAMSRFEIQHGIGDGITSACVMTAAGWLAGFNSLKLGRAGHWSDAPLSVCGTLRNAYINLNDILRHHSSLALLWPHVKKCLDTKTCDPAIESERDAILKEGARKFNEHFNKARSESRWVTEEEENAATAEYLEAFDRAIEVGKCHAIAFAKKAQAAYAAHIAKVQAKESK